MLKIIEQSCKFFWDLAKKVFFVNEQALIDDAVEIKCLS